MKRAISVHMLSLDIYYNNKILIVNIFIEHFKMENFYSNYSFSTNQRIYFISVFLFSHRLKVCYSLFSPTTASLSLSLLSLLRFFLFQSLLCVSSTSSFARRRTIINFSFSHPLYFPFLSHTFSTLLFARVAIDRKKRKIQNTFWKEMSIAYARFIFADGSLK